MTKGSVKHNKRTLLTNAAWNWSSFATSVVVTFIVCPIYVRTLGDTSYGVWSLVESIVAYFALLDLGIGASVVRFVAKFEAIEDHDELNRVFSTTCGIFIVAGLIAIVGSACLAIFWEHPLNVPADLVVEARWLILLLGCNVAIELIGGVFSAALFGLGRFPAKVSTEIGIKIGGAVAMVTALAAGYGLLGIGVVCLASTLIKGCLMALFVRRYLPSLRLSTSSINRNTFRVVRGYSILAFVAMIAGRISFSTDSIVIGAFLSPAFITYFVLAARLTEYGKRSVGALVAATTPVFTSLNETGDHLTTRILWKDGTRYVMWLVIPLQVGLTVLGYSFLSLWMGDYYAKRSYITLLILSISMGPQLSQYISGRLLYGTGKLRFFTVLAVAEAMTNLALSILLVGRWGIEGVALGTAIPSLLHTCILAIYVCKMLGVSPIGYLSASVFRPLTAVAIPFLIWMVGRSYITNWLSFAIVLSMGLAVYCITAIMLEIGWARVRSSIRFLGLHIYNYTNPAP